MDLNFIDLFAGAGGLSEGFIQAGFTPLAHVEIDEAASNTLRTRAARHWLKNNNKYHIYDSYLEGKITRNELWEKVPREILSTIINKPIGKDSNPQIFKIIDGIIQSRNVDLIIGGPPCQAYSIAGRSRDRNGMKNDSRNFLYIYYAEFLKKYKPKYFVFENVLGLLSAKDDNDNLYFDKMKMLFESIGYSIKYKILNCTDFGIPQNRKRIILIGSLFDNIPYPELKEDNLQSTIFELFQDLPSIKSGEGVVKYMNYKKTNRRLLERLNIYSDSRILTWHSARPNNEQDLEIYKIAVNQWDINKRLNYNDLPDNLKSHKNRKSHTDRFKVVAGEMKYSHTIVAHIAKDGHYYIHPDKKQNRSLTPREAARLQTFPDDYFFEGIKLKPSRTAAFKQIGNAVPVLLSKKVALSLKETICQKKN